MGHKHGKPVSRRDFLAAGLLPFGAQMIVPNWMKLLLPEKVAHAATCNTSVSGMIPFVTLDLAGGAGLQANYVPTDQGGQLLTSYSKMGLGTAPNVIREFGNVPFAAADMGLFLTGLKTTANADTVAKTAFVGLCVRSRDDSNENLFSVAGMLARAGLIGTQLPNMGSTDSITGGRHLAAVVAPPAPLVVKNFNDIRNSLGYAASVGTRLSAKQKESLAKLVSKLNETQSRKLAAMQSGAEVKNLLDCAGIKNESLVGGTGAAVNPVQDANTGIAAAWGINAQTGTNNQSYVFGSMVYNALNGQAGSVTLEMGGYDYHGNARATTNQRDQEAGAVVGRVLQTASAMNKPVFVYVTTDGSVGTDSATPGTDWNGDRGTAGMAYILYFNPTGRPQTNGFQIGHYLNEQAAADNTLVGGSPEIAAAAVFANYLQANNRLDLFAGIAGRTIPTADLSKVLKFG